MRKQNDAQYLSIRQVAELLGVSRDTVRRRIIAGMIKGEKVNGRWRIPRKEVDALREQVRKQDAQPAQDILIQTLKERIRELEADKAYLQERIVTLEKLLESLTPKALPKPSLRERIKRIFKRSSPP